MNVKTLLIVAILVGLLSVPSFADIVPNEPEPTAEDPAPREAVREQLGRLGVDALEARLIADSLRPEEARFFADSEQANAVAAGLWLEEWIGAAIYVWFIGHQVEKNAKHYLLLND
jgi:hypothetical protein